MTAPLLGYDEASTRLAGPVLERVAAAAENAPALAGTGRYRYPRTESWALSTGVAGEAVTSVLVSGVSEVWRLPDGQARRVAGSPGRRLRRIAGQSVAGRTGSRQTRDAALAGVGDQDFRFGDTAVPPRPLIALAELADAETAELALAAESGGEGVLIGTRTTLAIRALFCDQPIPPEVRAKLWRLLATVPGVVGRGEVTDRAGRRGVAVSVDDDGTSHGLPSRYLFVLDPRTGQLLEWDNVLMTHPGKLNVSVPRVVSLTVFLGAGYVDSVNARPPAFCPACRYRGLGAG